MILIPINRTAEASEFHISYCHQTKNTVHICIKKEDISSIIHAEKDENSEIDRGYIVNYDPKPELINYNIRGGEVTLKRGFVSQLNS